MVREKIVCQCGGRLSRPIPDRCPHCGAAITSVRKRLWPQLFPIVLVAGLFAVLAAFVYWMANRP